MSRAQSNNIFLNSPSKLPYNNSYNIILFMELLTLQPQRNFNYSYHYLHREILLRTYVAIMQREYTFWCMLCKCSCGKIWEYVKWPTNLQRCSVSELNDHNNIHADNLDYVHVHVI